MRVIYNDWVRSTRDTHPKGRDNNTQQYMIGRSIHHCCWLCSWVARAVAKAKASLHYYFTTAYTCSAPNAVAKAETWVLSWVLRHTDGAMCVSAENIRDTIVLCRYAEERARAIPLCIFTSSHIQMQRSCVSRALTNAIHMQHHSRGYIGGGGLCVSWIACEENLIEIPGLPLSGSIWYIYLLTYSNYLLYNI